MRKLMLGAALLLGAATPVACSKKLTAQDCEKFADHMTELTLKEVASATGPRSGQPPGAPAPAEHVKQIVHAQRPSFVQQCSAGGIPRAAYDCIMEATTVAAMTDCRGNINNSPRGPLG